ncbi:MAG: hypothetical protein Kow0077_32970 [Anaerolineae bacterium]
MTRAAVLTGLLAAAVLLVAACAGPAPASIAEIAPLDREKPTFLFFFTDN